MKTIAKLLALCMLLGTMAFALPQDKKDDSTKPASTEPAKKEKKKKEKKEKKEKKADDKKAGATDEKK